MKQKERKNTMGILKILMMILFIINVGQAFCDKNDNSISKDIMSGIDENDNDPALMHPLEMFFPGLTIQDFQPEEIPTAVNEQAVLPAQAPIIEQQEQEVENVLEIYLGSLEGTDTGLLVQAVQTGDMRPYVSFFKGETKHRVNRFLDQVFPGDDQISFIASNGWSKGDFKAALGDAIDIATFDVVAPASCQMRDLACTHGSVFSLFLESIEHFIDSLSCPINENIVINQDALHMYTIQDDVCSYYGLKWALIGCADKIFPDTTAVEHATGVYPSVLAGTSTELLLQAMWTGDMEPYVSFYKDQVKGKISQFLDQIFPSDDESGFINLAINHHLLPAHTKGAFKTAINETIDTAVVQVDAPTSHQMRDLAYTHAGIGFELYLRVHTFFDSFTDDISMLDPSIIVDQNALSMANIYDDVRSRDGLREAFASFFE